MQLKSQLPNSSAQIASLGHTIMHVMRPTVLLYNYVTVFWKTDHLDTRTEIHLLPVRDRHTHALSRNTKH